MGSSKLAVDSHLKAGAQTSKKSAELLIAKEHRKSMFLPRYVSEWCTSKRKRCFDLALSIVALALFTPVMILIGWVIRMTSAGPALFRQERVGLHQQTFVILKFRTMKHACSLVDRGSKVTKQGDPRMTAVGALLRRSKLDELPQLINVARGEMSFVGPRPKIPQHECLHMLSRPGITGAATVVFSDEEHLLADVPENFVEHYVTTVLNPEKCRLDAHYIETARFSTDIRILLRTLFKPGSQPESMGEPQHAPYHRKAPSMTRSVSSSMASVNAREVLPLRDSLPTETN
jgi:lipopolysaccharide/colanic/teichoic acid biosynthesis glycosyltransferase